MAMRYCGCARRGQAAGALRDHRRGQRRRLPGAEGLAAARRGRALERSASGHGRLGRERQFGIDPATGFGFGYSSLAQEGEHLRTAEARRADLV